MALSNALITPTIITKAAHAALENLLVMGSKVDRQWENSFKKVGNSMTIRRPVRYDSLTGPNITSDITSGVNTEEANTTLTLDTHKTVAMQFSATDLSLTIEEFNKRYIVPAAMRLAADVENSIAGLYTNIYNFVGTVGTVPSTLLSIGAADVKLINSGTPENAERVAFYEPNASLNLANALSSVQPNDIAKRAIEKAMINQYAGFDVFRSVHPATHTFGTNDGAGAMNGGSQETTYALSKSTWTQTIDIDTFTTTDTFKAGDIITIAGANAYNQQTKSATGALQQFVITADATCSSGAATVTISPPMIVSGPYQTIVATPDDGAVVTPVAYAAETAKQNLLFSPDAITLAMANYKAPSGLQSEIVSDNNISITYSWDGDIQTHLETHRLDVLYGVKLVVPQHACRHTS